MNTITYTPTGQPWTDVIVTGTTDELRQAVYLARHSGRLISTWSLRTDLYDGQRRICIRVRKPMPKPSPALTGSRPHTTHRRHHRATIIVPAAALTLAGTMFILGYLGVGAALLGKVLAVIVGVLVITGVVISRVDGGRHHCPGCPDH